MKQRKSPNRNNRRASARTVSREDGLTEYLIPEPEFVERTISADVRSAASHDTDAEHREGAERTIDISITSEAEVVDGFGDREIIDHDAEEFDLSRFRDVGAVLVNHDPNQRVAAPLEVRLNPERRRSEATIQFADNEAGRSALAEATEHGTLRGVSGGFLVDRWIWLEDEKSIYKNRIIGPAWVGVGNQLIEASLTPIPADASVGVARSAQRNERNEDRKTMKWWIKFLRAHDENLVGEVVETEKSEAQRLIADGTAERSESPSDELAAPAVEELRSEAPKTQTGETRALVDDALRAERTRCADIRTLAVEHSVDLNALIDSGASVHDARQVVIDSLTVRNANRATASTGGSVEMGEDGRISFRQAVSYGLQLRAGGDVAARARENDEGRSIGSEEFAAPSYSLIRVAEECLRRANIPVPTNADEIFSLAMRGPSVNSFDLKSRANEPITVGTSDFPLILANVANKAMLAAIELAETTYRSWCRIGSGSDFKAMSRLRISEAGKLSEVPEFGTFPTTKFGEQREQITIKTYGEVFNLSRQAIINDDVSAFTEIPGALGRAAAILPNDLAVKILMSNPTMSDSVALFAAGHNNLTASAGNAFTSVANARSGIGNVTTLLMQQSAFQQSDLSSEQMKLRLRPSVLLIPPTNWENASAVLGGTSFGAGVEGVNPFNGIATAVIEPSLEDTNMTGNSSTAYYLFAAPSAAPIIEVAFLNGVETPFMEEVVNSGSAADGRVFKVRLDCVAGAVDWRGAQKEDGA